MQPIANTAGFHFAFIEQGGASLSPTLVFKATDPEVLRVLVSIGGGEIDHFGLWHDKAGNALAQPLAGVSDPETGVTFPDLNALNSELDQTNLIVARALHFHQQDLAWVLSHPSDDDKEWRGSGDDQGVYRGLTFSRTVDSILRFRQPARSRSRFGAWRILIRKWLHTPGAAGRHLAAPAFAKDD